MRKSGRKKSAEAKTSFSLLAQIRKRDQIAWNRFVSLYSPMVYFWCNQSGLPIQEIPDVFQEVFHSVTKNLTTYRHRENGSFRGWLRTITRNKIHDHFRKKGREPQSIGGTQARLQFDSIEAPQNDNPQPDSDLENVIFSNLLESALADIRPEFRETTWQAFWKIVIEGRETKDVADELDLKPGTARVAKSRVLQRLRRELGECQDLET